MLNVKKEYYTPAEYFALEETAEYKSEYYDGEIFAMAGGTPNHDRIGGNIYAVLNIGLRGTTCEPFTSDMRIQVDKQKHYVYPDVSVICGKPLFAEGRQDILANPVVIVEVLSDATRDYDRGSKFTAYRQIDTLRDYVLIEQERVFIEYFHKNETGIWVLTEYNNETDILKLKSIDFEIPLSEIYNRVEFTS